MARSLSVSRRTLLAGLAGTGPAYFLPSLGRDCEAAPPPRRLLVFYTIHGNPYPHWRMRREGLRDDAAWEIDLRGTAPAEWSRTFAPLHAHRDKLLILDTLSNVLGGSHYLAEAALLTGSYSIGKGTEAKAGGPSIDQIVAARVAQPGRLRSLELGVPTGGGRGALPYKAIWQGRGVTMPVIVDQAQAFGRLFDGAAAAPAPAGAETRERKIERARRQILELERARTRALAGRLSGGDRARLESHADMMGDLAARLRAAEEGLTARCDRRPALATGAGTPTSQRVDNFGRMIAAAFACDLTRVASIQFGQLAAGDFGFSGDNVHGEIAHHADDARKILGMSDYYRIHAAHFATLLEHLRQVKEPDGSTLLDNTIVLWTPELGSWVHQHTHVPVVIAGGAGFAVGRYVHFPADVPAEGALGSYRRLGPPMSKLLVSVAQQMGLADVSQVGDAASARGQDLRGPLPGLLGPLPA